MLAPPRGDAWWPSVDGMNSIMLLTVYLLLNASCITFSSSVCVCVKQRGRGESDAGRKKCAVFLESPVFRLWHLTAEEGMNRCTLFMHLTGVPESSLLSPLCWQASRRSSADLLWAVLLSPPPPTPSLSHKPAHGTRRWGPHQRLQLCARGPIKKKATLCAVFSQV